MRKFILFTLMLLVTGSITSLNAQNTETKASTIVDIALNGIPVVIDGDLSDWDDAHFIFLSQDSPFFLDINGNPIQGVPASPNDFSAFVAIKMDNEHIYIAAKVRDEGTPMIGTPDSPNLAFNYDHMSVYLGLYNIGDLPGSPHLEGPGEFYFINANQDSVQSNRTYRIGPGLDDTESTLGPDYQLLIRAVEHDPATFDSRAHTYSGAYMDTTIGGTVAATAYLENEFGEYGYILEWKIPFASLAGDVAKGTGPYSGKFEWPLFTPAHNMIIPFDIDITDLDEGNRGANRFLRAGQYPALWRDSKSFGMRGRIIDLSVHPNDRPNSKYYVDFKTEQNVVIDGEWDDWADAMFYGNSQDHPHFLQTTNNAPVQGVPTGPTDFSYFYAMKMDAEHVYVGILVRDEGTPMISTPDSPNLAFNYDHLSVYLGLYDIEDRAGSPHLEGPGEFYFINANQDSVLSNRTYRIGPGLDDTESTLGPDYQLLIRAVDHDPATFDSRAHTYSGAYMDTTLGGTVAASRLLENQTGEYGYFLEWKIPLASLAGDVAKGTGPYSGKFEWPLFQPEVGQVLVFDADVTDMDEADAGLNRYLRLGRMPSLWRDSKSFGMRGEVVAAGVPNLITSTPREHQLSDVYDGPGSIALSQNYPNPFNPSTLINYAVRSTGYVKLSVYDLLGREIAVLAEGVRTPGSYQVWFDASTLSSGVYIYRITNGNESVVRKMTLVK